MAKITVAIALTLALSLAGCATTERIGDTSGSTEHPADTPLVLTTFTITADIAREVAGDHLRVESITKPGIEVHGYEPTPHDIRLASEAVLIVDNGLGLEAWFEQFLEQVDAPRVLISEGVEPLQIAADNEAEPGADDIGAPNPHAWMSPLSAMDYVDNLAAAFSELAPEHAADFDANAEAYKNELQSVQDELVDRLSALPDRQRALVTCEGAFSYLARDAGLTEQYIWPVNSEQQATPRQIADTIEFVRSNEVPAVFCESTVSDRAMQQVVESTDAVYGGTLYVDSLSETDGPVPTYLDLIRHDVDLIVDGLAAHGGDEE